MCLAPSGGNCSYTGVLACEFGRRLVAERASKGENALLTRSRDGCAMLNREPAPVLMRDSRGPDARYPFSAMVGMARCAVPARAVAGGSNIQGSLAIEAVAPLHAARTSQRDVPTTLNKAPLTLILSPLRAGRGEQERTFLGSLLGEPDTVPPKVPLSLSERERVRVRVRLDCMDTAQRE